MKREMLPSNSNATLRIEILAHVFDIYFHATHFAEADARGGASEHRAHAGLLPFLVRAQQVQEDLEVLRQGEI